MFLEPHRGGHQQAGSDITAWWTRSRPLRTRQELRRSPVSDEPAGLHRSRRRCDLPRALAACSQIARPTSGCNSALCQHLNTSDNGIAKIDYHLNDKNTIAGMFFLGDYTSIGEDHRFVAQQFTDSSPIRTWSTVESWVYTPSSTVVNEMHFGYDRVDFAFSTIVNFSMFRNFTLKERYRTEFRVEVFNHFNPPPSPIHRGHRMDILAASISPRRATSVTRPPRRISPRAIR